MRLTEHEPSAIAAFLNITEGAFTDEFTTLSADRRALVLNEGEGGVCILLGADNLCRINPVKPRQCREFPFSWQNEDSATVCSALRALG